MVLCFIFIKKIRLRPDFFVILFSLLLLVYCFY